MPRHFSRERDRAYFESSHYKESKEYAAEEKIELFFNKLKNLLLRKGKDGK
jgi:hypothetical protein